MSHSLVGIFHHLRQISSVSQFTPEKPAAGYVTGNLQSARFSISHAWSRREDIARRLEAMNVEENDVDVDVDVGHGRDEKICHTIKYKN